MKPYNHLLRRLLIDVLLFSLSHLFTVFFSFNIPFVIKIVQNITLIRRLLLNWGTLIDLMIA